MSGSSVHMGTNMNGCDVLDGFVGLSPCAPDPNALDDFIGLSPCTPDNLDMAPVTPPLGLQSAPAAIPTKRRLTKKQHPPPAYVEDVQKHEFRKAVHNEALVKEAWSEVTALDSNAQRQHVHYTHVRTHCSGDIQPDSFTRQQFWDHMVRACCLVLVTSILLRAAVYQ